MDNTVEVTQRSVALAETMQEGVAHIKKLLQEGKYEQTVSLLDDIVQGFASVSASINQIKDDIDTENIRVAEANLRNGFDAIVTAYERKNYGQAQEIIQFTLQPKLKAWHDAMEDSFKSYLIS
ncbi:hypothetical protein FLK61_37620 [Paenalkalicoccus suaedae]|uniref:DUF8042 domain-containing protein n=1 Tax=Paenalkalicoccus suaedae TaxID=2592382 RepID=A0A859FH23_9BACI|nr:hypothetical protein [Paenalkalicoccus suaedae]QKS72351.1 hypothetical protein FLK61_37620 [Paenalkalicoccus suaedae]